MTTSAQTRNYHKQTNKEWPQIHKQETTTNLETRNDHKRTKKNRIVKL